MAIAGKMPGSFIDDVCDRERPPRIETRPMHARHSPEPGLGSDGGIYAGAPPADEHPPGAGGTFRARGRCR